MDDRLELIYKQLCPNCSRNDVESSRLEKGLPCRICFPEEESINPGLLQEGRLKKFFELEEELKSWKEFFIRKAGFLPTSLQLAWAKRVLLNRSFALVAPTGIGKTTFGLVSAAYFASRERKVYLIFPTRVLVAQAKERLLKLGVAEEDVLAIEKSSRRLKEKLKRRDFKILVTTSMFLYKNFELIGTGYRLVFVDDVDSFLKTARNVDRLLKVLGFSQEQLEAAIRLIYLRLKQNKTESELEDMERLEEQLQELRPTGTLVVASATSRPRSRRVYLFRELLNFEVGVPNFYLRKVVDAATDYSEDNLYLLLEKLGSGILLFVPSDKGKDYVSEFVEKLNRKGIKAVSYEKFGSDTVKLFEEGKIKVIVGISSYRNPLARGIDLPHAVKSAVFYGIPKIIINLDIENNPFHLQMLLISLRPLLARAFPAKLRLLDKALGYLKQRLRRFPGTGGEAEAPPVPDWLRQMIKEKVLTAEILELIRSSNDVAIREKDSSYELVISDATGYLQASGRTSRMYPGGMTTGLSILMVDDEKAFLHLKKRLRFFNAGVEFQDLEAVDLDKVLKEIEAERLKVREFTKEKKLASMVDFLKPTLVVVESPTKARTIAGFFGKPVKRDIAGVEVYETATYDRYLMITASLGHVVDLVTGIGIYGVLKARQGFIPVYEAISGKEKVIEGIESASFESLDVMIATDPDTEGEKIACDLYFLLRPFTPNLWRMEFHEVTRRAFMESLSNPRQLDYNLVKAQVVRRIADRWVGFYYSEKLQNQFGLKNLSAGRVQTPVLSWIIEREKLFREKVFRVWLSLPGFNFSVSFDFEDRTEALSFYKHVRAIKIYRLQEKEEVLEPRPPFRTDTMLREASQVYSFSLARTMELAQDLFELGYITYHRTDSLRVGPVGLKLAQEYIEEKFGSTYYEGRVYESGGAHECIRPTRPVDPEELQAYLISGQAAGLTSDHVKLYRLIFNRFIASQMKPVKVLKRAYLIEVAGREVTEELPFKILEHGWDLVAPLKLRELPEGLFTEGLVKKLKGLPKAYPFTQGELVSTMKERGIGRPSTYAATVEKLFQRKYIYEKNGFVRPTRLGNTVLEALIADPKARHLLSEQFTRELEATMDAVEEGRAAYGEVLKTLFKEVFETAS